MCHKPIPKPPPNETTTRGKPHPAQSNQNRGFWPLMVLLSLLWLAVTIAALAPLGCPGAAKVGIEAPIRATGVHVGAETNTENKPQAGRDSTIWNITFGDWQGWTVAGLSQVLWGVAAWGRRRRDRVARTLVNVIEEGNYPWVKVDVKAEGDPVVDAYVENLIHKKGKKAHKPIP